MDCNKLDCTKQDCNNRAEIDLHIHSTASDGTLSPYEILATAQNKDLRAIAITDHDTIDGSKQAIKIGIPSSLKFLTGVEISVTPPSAFLSSSSFHLLGYSIRLDDPVLNKALDVLQEARKNRNPKIVGKLNYLGFNFSIDDLRNEIGKGQIGRPHIAKFMIAKGFVKSIGEAFDKYLGQGKPAYVEKYRIDCDKAIKIILDAGGIPVLAHPILLEFQAGKTLEDFIISLKPMGLKGIEVYYSEHSPDDTAYYSLLAKRYGLLMTGGSDFHGSLKPDIQMGSGKGNLVIPYALYEKIVESS